jgi:hypothetical protein
MLKEVKDYLPELQEKFPYLCKKDIKLAVEYGWRMLYWYTLYGCDSLITMPRENFWCYFGYLTSDSLRHFTYYIKRLCKKIRILYHHKKPEWNGYYYFGLNEEEYSDLKKTKTQVGRKRVHFTFGKKVSYKILDEAKIRYSWSRCIIGYKYPVDMKDSFYTEVTKCDNPEIILEREHPCTFKDILIYNNNYDNI